MRDHSALGDDERDRAVSQRAVVILCSIDPFELISVVSRGFNATEMGVGVRSAYAERFWRGVTEQADREDCQLLIYPGSVRGNVNNVDAFHNGSADGVVFFVPPTDPRPLELARRGFPVITIDPPRDPSGPVSAVYAEESQAVDVVLTHLWSLGHRRITHLVGPVRDYDDPGLPHIDPSRIAVARMEAFVSWMKRWGVDDPELVQHAHAWTADYVEQPVRVLMDSSNPPTALFCANDRIALKAMEVAQAMGLRVPEDLSVVGIDNLPASAVSDPPLTTVDVEIEEIGRQSILGVSTLINAEASVVIRKSIPVASLVVRASTAPVRRG